MVKNGNSITTNLLMTSPTSEKNGVEVTVKGIKDLKVYDEALQYIVFFPNIYIDGAYSSAKINSTKLKKFKNFVAASIYIPSKLLLGNVLYPIQNSYFNPNVRSFLTDIMRTGIAIKFDVGEINITPNRENIIYTSDTIKKIEKRILAAKEELESLISAKISKDYDDLDKYYTIISNPVQYDPVTDSIMPYGYYYSVYPRDIPDSHIMYKGVDLKNSKTFIHNILRTTLPNFKGVVCDCKIYNKKIPYNAYGMDQLKTPKLLILNRGARLTELAKCYIRENYNDYGIITDISKTEFSSWLKSIVTVHNLGTSTHLDFIIENLYKDIMKKAEKLDLDKDSEFLKYKTEVSTGKRVNIKELKGAILYVWDTRGYKDKRTFERFSQAVEYIKKQKKGIILTNMDADDTAFSTIASLKGYLYIKARKSIVEEIKKLNLKCIVDIDWLTSKDPMLSIVKTILRHFPVSLDLSIVDEIRISLDKSLQKEFGRLESIYKKFCISSIYRRIALKDSIPYDPYTGYLCFKLKNYIIKYSKAKEIANSIGCSNTTITEAVIMKTKAYKISGEAYNRIKNNRLLRVLCRK